MRNERNLASTKEQGKNSICRDLGPFQTAYIVQETGDCVVYREQSGAPENQPEEGGGSDCRNLDFTLWAIEEN